jgi:hypothetical protein
MARGRGAAPDRRAGGRLLAGAVLLAVAGCKLIDQRTFEDTAQAPAAADLARANLPKLPLMTISFVLPDADWRPAVRDAVEAAQARKFDVAFRVVTPIPASASQDEQDKVLKRGSADAALVAQEIHRDGIPQEHITIEARSDAGTPPREVRIYVQ